MIWVISFLLSFAWAEDSVVFQCGKGGQLIDVAYPPSMLKRQAAYSAYFDKSGTAGQTCENCSRECSNYQEKEEIIGLATQAALTALPRSSEGRPFVQTSEEVFRSFKKAEQQAKMKAICEKKPGFEPENYVQNVGLVLFYPYETNWMYITGCRSLSEKSCEPVFLEGIRKSIFESVAMGVDPYAVLAKGFLENGQEGPGTLYLDPVGAMDSMGCKGTPAAKYKEGKTLDSYGTFYEFNQQVREDPKLAERLGKFLNVRGVEAEPKTSYLCRDILSAEGGITSKPQSNQCCLKLPFTPKGVKAKGALSRALVYEQMRKTLANRFRNKRDPAFRLQRFNGYTNMMGGAESVPVFRAGVNFYKEPAYGFQGLDFIINSLMINPKIRSMVSEAQAARGEYPSLVCAEAGEGYHSIDSDFYFQAHAQAKRFEGVKDKVLAGKDLTNRETSVFDTEVTSSLRELLGIPFLGANEDEIAAEFRKRGVNLRFEKYQGFDEVMRKMNDEDKRKIPQQDLAEIKTLFTDLSQKESALEKGDADFKRAQEIRGRLFLEIRRMGMAGDFQETFEKFSADLMEKTLAALPETFRKAHAKDLQFLISYQKRIDENPEKNPWEEIRSLRDRIGEKVRALGLSQNPFQVIDYFSSDFDRILKESKVTESQLQDPKLASMFAALKTELAGHNDPKDYYHQYFKEVYSKRDTVSKASTYSWKPLTEEQLRELARNYQRQLK